ncbi:MAG: ABC transporter permease [Desulfitobacteriia bacterium]|jgi:sulfonate transport system permease protein
MTLNYKQFDSKMAQVKTNGKNTFKIIIRGIVFPVLVLIIWELAARLHLVNEYFLPSPSKIFDTFSIMLLSGELAEHLLASVRRLIYGFLITVVFAIPLGILVGKTKYFRHYVNPTLSFLQQIPPIAWIPIFILWLGIDEANKVAVIVYASFFPVFLNTVHGVNSVDPRLVEVGRAYMLTPLEMVRRIYIPSAVMSIFVGLRLGLSNCWRALVGAELIAASSGIGYLITEGRTLSQPNTIFVAIFTIGVAGSLLDLTLKRTERKLMPWKKRV